MLEATDWLKQYVGRVKGTLDPIEDGGDRQPVGDEQPEEREERRGGDTGRIGRRRGRPGGYSLIRM